MATFRKLPSGKINVQVRLAGQSPRSATFPSKELAEKWACEQEREICTKAVTIVSLIETYMNEIMIRNGKKRGGYLATYHRFLTISRVITGSLETLTKDEVVAYRQERLKHVSGSTVRLEIQLLGRLLRWAIDEKEIECIDATKGVKLPEPGKPRTKVVEPFELEMILERSPFAAQDFFKLAYETAMRRSELLAVTPRMINFRKRVITLSDDMTKNGEGREVPLTKKAVEILERLCDGKDRNSRLFIYSPYGITQAFRRAARLAGVTDVCLHSLRHSAITRFAEMGLSTMQLRAISGHKTVSMLARYTHVKAASVVDLIG